MNITQQISTLEFTKAQPMYRQIAEAIRAMILDGRIVPGTKLPPSRELEALWKANPLTIHTALSLLAKEGLLERTPRRGTFVRQREPRLTCVGIYNSTTGYGGSGYLQALHAALQEELARLGVEMDVWLDPRPAAEHGKPWLPLVRAAEHREFQGLIVETTGLPLLQWQRRLPVPTAFQTAANLPNAVSADHARFAELSVRALAQQGCRSLGIISTLPTETANVDGSRHILAELYGRITDLASDWGLTLKNDWMRMPATQPCVGAQPQEQFGYREFLELWSQPERPAGLIVFPDTAARGVILAAQQLQVRVPAELKLVLHKNEAVDLLCPMPATLAVLSERAVARALIAQLQKQFRGEACERILIRFDTVSNPNRQPTKTPRSGRSQ